MDPVTLVLATLAAKSTIDELTGTVFGGLVEGLTGIAVFEALPKYVRKLLPVFISKSEPPVNHDLQKAILSAHWMATWVITDYLKKQAEKQGKNEAAHKVIINAAKDQLKKLKDKNYFPSASPDTYEAGELILKDSKIKPITSLKASVIEFHLAELRNHSGTANTLIAYKEIEESIQNGQPDWFELVCAFLNELLKGDNNKAKDAFQNQELAKISVETRKLMQNMEEYSLNCISRIGEEQFEHFKEVVSLELQEIKASLTRIEDYLIKANDKLDTLLILHFTSRQESKELNLDKFPDFKQMSDEIEVLNLDFESKQSERREVEEFLAEEINDRKKQRYERELTELNRELLNIDEQRNQKKAALVEFRSYIEKTWLSLYSTVASPRLLEARERFENGDLTGANNVLDASKLQDDFDKLQQISILIEQQKESLSQEYLAKANFTVLEKANANWFEETKGYYQKAIELKETYDTYFAFAKFLYNHRQFGEAFTMYPKVLIHANSDEKQAKILNNLASLQIDTNQHLQAEQNLQEVLTIYRRLEESNPHAYEADVASTLNNLAFLQQSTNQHLQAEQNYQEVLTIYRRLAEHNPHSYEGDVARSLNNLALLQQDTNQYGLAEQNYQEALTINRRLAESDPHAYEAYMATTLNNLALLQQVTNQYELAESNYQEALKIRRRLAESNPHAYEADVAITLNNLAGLQKVTNQYVLAEQNSQEALKIRRRLAESNPHAYEADVALTLNNLANLQQATNQHALAEQNYQEALTIYCRLTESNPDAYEAEVARILNNLASLQRDTKQYALAEQNFQEALTIYCRLAESNFEVYQISLARTQLNMAIFYYNILSNRELSLQLAYEATINAASLRETLPLAMKFYQLGFQIWEKWGEDLGMYLKDNP